MAAVEEENKQRCVSYNMLLFINDDGKPMEFHMTPCPQKEHLKTLVEVGK